MSVQRLPEVRLTIPNSVWPQVDNGPLGQAAVETFSTEREIVSGALPGQIRAVSGFSIGSGSATVPQSGSDRPFTPWSKSHDRLVSVGALAQLEAIYEGGNVEPLGAWKVASAAGALGSGVIQIPLAETVHGSKQARLPVPCYPYVDGIWIIDMLARQAGYYATPAPVESCILSVPGVGGICADVGHLTSNVAPTFTMSPGQPAIASGQFHAPLVWSGTKIYLTLNTPGSTFTLGEIQITFTLGGFTITGAGSDTKTFTAGLNPDWPLRVQAEIISNGTTTSMRVRSTNDDTKWSALATVTGDGIGDLTYVSGTFNGLQVSTAAEAGLWTPPTAQFNLLDAIIERPWIDAKATLWQAIQETVRAFAGAGWLTRHGILRILNRHDLAGVNSTPKPFDAAVLAEDVPWQIAEDDHADRMVVTWSPLGAPDEDEITEWSVGAGKLHITAGQTASYIVDLGGFTETVYGFAHAADADALADASTWEANTQADGEGTEVTSGITVTTERLSPSAVLVRVTNSTAQTVWLVDYMGEPALTLRGIGVWQQDTQAQIIYGVGEAGAKNEITLDLGPLAQDETTASSIAAYLWDRARINRWRALSIRIPLDLSMDVGDVLALFHLASDLRTDAIITRISLSGRNGEIGQVIDLAILEPTVAAFDAIWNGKTVAEFDAEVAGMTVSEFDSDPLKVG